MLAAPFAHALPDVLVWTVLAVFWLGAFAVLWVVIITLLSRLGGWHVLANRFTARQPFAGPVHGGCSGRLGLVNYNRCLTLGANEQGLYLSVPRMFAFAHPPLLIPWSEVRAIRDKILWAEIVRFELGNAPATKLQIHRRFSDKLESTAGGHLLIAPKAG